jgi:C-lobe and N-lobe beta barrels of Tf-binding protein B
MRFASLMVLMATGTALSGCAGNQLDAIANLSSSCTSTAQTLNCAGPNSGTTGGGGTTTPPTTGTGTTPPNTGNTSTIAAGDVTIAAEKGITVSTKATPAQSKLTGVTYDVAGNVVMGSTAQIEINTNTASNSNWPIPKTMTRYPAGTGLGVGLGGTYNEYRAYSRSAGATAVDEELQVWSWNKSYVTQYRDVTSSPAPAGHAAWSFGGKYTVASAIPTGGTATYDGKFTATALTSNWLDDPSNSDQTLSANGVWSVLGDTHIVADFASSNIDGTLHPLVWKGYQSLNGATGFIDTTVADALSAPGTARHGNWKGFMNEDIHLAGVISKSTAAGAHPNAVVGTAHYDPNGNWINSSTGDQMYAGFFGDKGEEIAGVFSLDATRPDPIGGQTAIENDRRGYVSMVGAFHGTCTSVTGGSGVC